MSNKYPGICLRCHAAVAASAGECAKNPASGRWEVTHTRCPASPSPVLLNSPAPSQPAALDPVTATKKFGRDAIDGAAVKGFTSMVDAHGKREVIMRAIPKDGTVRTVKGKRYVQIDHSQPRFFSADDREDFDQFDSPAGWEYSWSGVEIVANAAESEQDAKTAAVKQAKIAKIDAEKQAKIDAEKNYNDTKAALVAARGLEQVTVGPRNAVATEKKLVIANKGDGISHHLFDCGEWLQEDTAAYDDWRTYFYAPRAIAREWRLSFAAKMKIDRAKAEKWLAEYAGCHGEDVYLEVVK